MQHHHPDNEEEWFKVEDVEELAEIMEDIHQVVKHYLETGVLQEGDITQTREHSTNTLGMIAGYCFTFGGGVDVGGPIEMGYLEDGSRDPDFFRRLAAAWTRTLGLYLEENLENYWLKMYKLQAWWMTRLKKKIRCYEVNDFIDWAVIENSWGDDIPPCDHFRRFGGVANVIKEDLYAEERVEMGIDEFAYE